MKDKQGRELVAGQKIVWAVRTGDTSAIRWGRVEEITSREHYGVNIPVLKVRVDDACLLAEKRSNYQHQRKVVNLEMGDRILIVGEYAMVASQPAASTGFTQVGT